MKEKVDAAHKSLESGCAVSKSIQGEIQEMSTSWN
jgi:organic hydroperoxide reductase OsmC/OhrA